MEVCCNVDTLCEAAMMVQEMGGSLGGGAWGEGLTQSSLGFSLQHGVTMETASIAVVKSRWLLQSGRNSRTELVIQYKLWVSLIARATHLE